MAEAAALSLAGRQVIVIGGSSGIGFAIATLAEALGANVVVASSSAAKVDAAVGRLTGAVGATIDLRDESGVKNFFESIGSFDHLAITAGDWSPGCLAASATSTWRRRATASRYGSGGR